MVSAFLLSYRNSRENSRELENVAETRTSQLVLPKHFWFSQTRVSILLLYFFSKKCSVGNIQGKLPEKH